MREPGVAGQFYESSKEDLKRQIDSCFNHKLGAGKFPKATPRKIYSVIVPHAGYPFSAYCATHAYSRLYSVKEPVVFIIIGPNHTGVANAPFSISFEDFSTPLGIAKNDASLGLEITHANRDIIEDEPAHTSEHSIEVQLPLIQNFFKNFSIIPIIASTQDYAKLTNLSKNLADMIKKQQKRVVLIASSDFTHYGPNYNFVPFPLDEKTKHNLYSMDKKVIDSIISLDTKGFYEQAKNSTICGLSPITIIVETSKLLGAKKAELLKYYTSGDIVQDYRNAVGYASLILR